MSKQPDPPDNADAFYRLVMAEAARSASQQDGGFGGMPPVFSSRAVRWLETLAGNLGLINADEEAMKKAMDAGVRR